MAGRVAKLEPHRMSTLQLFQRGINLTEACRFAHGRNTWERERLLDELHDVLLELQMRGVQLPLPGLDDDPQMLT